MTASALTDSLRETLACFDNAGVPRTTSEVADRLDLGRRSTYDRLDRLVERDRLETKKVGASARVWWQPPAAGGRATAGGDQERTTVTGPLVDDVINDAEIGLFVLDADLEVVWLNQTAERYFDLDREHAVGRDKRALVTDHLSTVIDDGASFAETVLATYEDNTYAERFECLVTASENREARWLEHRSKPIESGDYAGGRIELYYDVSDRKRSEHAHRAERTLLERVLEASPTGIGIFDADGEVQRVNQQFIECLGLAGDDPETYVLGDQPLLDEDGAVIPYAERPAPRVLATGESVVDQHSQVRGHDGQLRWLSINAEPIDDHGVVVTIDNITKLKEQARHLERQHDELVAELEGVFERVDDAFYALDNELRFTYVNDRAETLLGHPESELLGRNIWQALSVDDADPLRDRFETALATQTDTSFERYSEPLDIWELVRVYPSESGLSIYFTDITEHKRKERQLREHEASLERTTELLEQSQQLANVGAWELDVTTTPADLRWTDEVYRIYGLSPDEEIEREQSISFYHPEDRPRIREAVEHAIEDGEPYDLTLRIEPADGGLRWVRGICNPVEADGEVVTLRGAFQDVTERIEHEQDLERQREQLAALNNLNDVVRSITDEVIAQSTREEIERVVCERLAETESYLFAWIGDVDIATQTVTMRTEAGVEGYLDEITISTDPDDERSRGPTGRAILERETQTTQDIEADSRHDPWRDHIEQYGFRSSAAIPIIYEDTVYGVLNVYADRSNAFEDEERAVISQLGEVVGHAIAATERKRALMSDDVVELQFRVRDIFAAVGADMTTDGSITIDHMVPIENDEYLVYGTITEDAIAGMDALVDALPHWVDVTYRTADGPTSFELRLSDPPVLSTIASLGGAIERVVIEDGDYRMTVLLAPGADVRRAIDVVQTTYPAAELLKHRQITRPDTTAERVRHVLTDELTDRQRAALEAAYHAGFFEWPRDATGEDISASLEIAPATFHQHLRRAQKKIFNSLLSDSRGP